MRKAFSRLFLVTFAAVSLSAAAHATDLPVGFISYDVTGANVAEFDISNFTGANASTFPDTTFPITTPLSLTDLSLTVDFANGTSEVFGPSYFTLDSDGLSLDGEQLSTLSSAPTGLFGADEATLTGDFSAGDVMLNGGGTINILSSFSATINDPSGLSDDDLAIIDATQTPEPPSWMMLATGLLLILFLVLARGMKRRPVGLALGLGLALLVLPGALKAQTMVKLSADTSPSIGSAGATTVSVTGTGFPSGAIAPGSVLVSLSATCGGAPTTAPASSVQNIIGTSDKIEFLVPGSLAAGRYFVSVSGTSASAVSFASGSSCSTINVVPGPSPVLTINTSNPVDWVISNGALTIDYNSRSGAIWSIVPTGTQDQLVDFSPADPLDGESALTGTPVPAGWPRPTGTGEPATNEPKGLAMDLAGFGAVAAVPGFSLTPTYLDWWVTFPSSSTGTINDFTYSEHFVVTPNDTGIHLYFVANHAATDETGSMGQVQWVYRDTPAQFTNMYANNADLSMATPVITPLPSVDDCFSSDLGRNDQDAAGFDTIDLHPQVGVQNAFSPAGTAGSGIPAGFHRHFCVKYDYSSYEYLHQAHGLFGGTYGVWAVLTAGHDTFVGGPEKQDLNFTGGILTIEPLSDHYTMGISLNPSGPGTTTTPQGSVLSNRLFGPLYVRINKFGGLIRTPNDMYIDALVAGGSFTNFYNHEATLLSNGYVSTTARGSVLVQQVTGVAGAPKTAWAVLSQPGVNHELSTVGYQYFADISANGSTIFTNVVPGTYRLSVYDLGQWGEYRNDNIVVTAGHTTPVPTINFTPEDFGTTAWTIGTPDRSAHEFLHGHYTQNFADGPLGFDDREYYGAWNYWADFASTGGAPVYNAAAGPNGPATNDLSKWNYAHWGAFDPGLYGGACVASDDTTDAYIDTGCTSLGDTIGIPAYVSSLPGASGTKGVTTQTPPWQIHFVTPSGSQSQPFVVLSQALAAAQAGEVVTLNGHSLTYEPNNLWKGDSTERSGLSGYTQWIAFQWPTSDLAAAGADNVITVHVAGVNTADTDDAFRLELSNLGAAPDVTGWNDYEFVTSGTTTPPNDAVPNP
jgi:hypothetical protein